MKYLIWTIIDIIIWLYFIYLFFGFIAVGRRIFWDKFKSFSVFILGFGLLQILSGNFKEDKNETHVVKINENYKQGGVTKRKYIKLEDNISLDILLDISYVKQNNTYIPVAYYTSLTEMVGSFGWKIITVQIDNAEPNKESKYTVYGTLKWKLFGVEVYSESKKFNGVVVLD